MGVEPGVVPAHADQGRLPFCGQGDLGRRAVDREAFVEQAETVEVRMVVEAVADHQVDAGVLVQVEDFAVGVQAQVDLRVRGVEAAETRHQPEGGEGRGGGDRQVAYAALRTQRVDALRNFQQGPVQAAEQPFAAVGQAHFPWQALEQRNAEPGFQRTDLVGNRGWRYRKLLGGGLEARLAGRRFEGAQRGQRQGSEHWNLHG
ncbi:hypothetical protein PAERUG_P5_London_26_VIM_2_01_09_04663 [Pseudomonas aeruginosa]|nr:hypothetical protein PAERUG_P5_London_26_VIM_2_01_09_04663 [Pseudomonas aeruginosa]